MVIFLLYIIFLKKQNIDICLLCVTFLNAYSFAFELHLLIKLLLRSTIKRLTIYVY